MNCRQVAKLIADGAGLPAEAQEHAQACPTCSRLAALGQTMPLPEVRPAVEDRIIQAITADLTAVDAQGPTWRYAVAIVAATITVAGAGILLLGPAGFAVDSGLQRSYFTTLLVAGILVCSTIVARLMNPGAMLPLPPMPAIQLAIACIAAGALLYPVTHHEHFLRAAGACVSIGLGHAAVSCGLIYLVVRRGALVWRPEMLSMVGLLGGLTGIAVLYTFCPHRDLGHFSLGHTTVPAAATAIGAWIAQRASR